jgi:hypothetical protein
VSLAGELKLNLEHTDQDENLDNVALPEAHTSILFQANIRHGRRSEGMKFERCGGKATGTAENEDGDIRSLTAQKYISKMWYNFLFSSESIVQKLCLIRCSADFEGTETLGNHVLNFQ